MGILREQGRCFNPGKEGFTLVEVMVSLGIITMVFVLLLGLRNNDIRINEHARNITAASLLARERMAFIDGFPDAGIKSGEFEGGVFSWEEEVSYTILDGVREVRVSVLWKNTQNGETKQVDFTTFLIK